MHTHNEPFSSFELSKLVLEKEPNITDASKIEHLKVVINYADKRYYVDSEPVLGDKEYDAYFKQLQQLEQTHPELVTRDSPTQRIAKGLSERFPTVSHLVPMLSLDNTYNATDLLDWDRRCKDLAGTSEIEYCVEPKYDGASISVIYEDNHLVRGATRGDGVMGEDVTINTKQIKSVPLSAKFKESGIQQIEIRGEVVIHKKVFEAYNEYRIAEGLAPLANPRNAASGTLRILDPVEVRKRGLSAVLYHISDYTLVPGADRPQQLNTHYGALQWLYHLGFPSPAKEMKVCKDITEVIAACTDFEALRDDLPFEVDGLVIKVNSIQLQEKMGMTTHHPRWAVAFKFKARQATSTLQNVEFQVGRTGAITPVAKITPVPIGGVTVSSVSLFNEDVIREKDLKIGDKVLVERAGDVIPYIVRSISEQRTGDEKDIVFPTECPVCKSALEKQADEAAWRCINISCPVQVAERMIHYVSKDAMDIRNLGGANIQKFFEQGILTDIPSIYHIDWDRVRALGGFGDKSISNMQQAIEQSKTQTLNRLIYGLGIRFVGETTAKTLANAVSHIKEFYDWDIERLSTLEDIGPKVATSVADFFHRDENRKMLDTLETVGVNLVNQQKGIQAEGILSGKTFLFTGTLSKLKRSAAEAMVEEKGGVISGSVNAKLNYLVVGEDAGSKLEKAKKLGTVAILTEDEFLDMIAK